jgi:flagellin
LRPFAGFRGCLLGIDLRPVEPPLWGLSVSGISLSRSVRSVLVSLQNTAAQLSAAQGRLATGNKVSTALDNPSAFFTSQSLSNRAGALNALVDGIGQAEQTLKAATNGITSISALVQTAKSAALQARQTQPPITNYAAIDQTASADVSAEAAGSVTGSVDLSGGAVVDGLQIQVGASTYTVHQASAPASESIAAIVADINNTGGLGPRGAVTASIDLSGKHIKLTANSTDNSFSVLPSTAATALGISGQAGTSTNLLQAVSGLSGTSLTVQANGGPIKTINFGAGGAQVSTFAELQAALAGTGVSASLAANNITLDVAGTIGTQNSLITSGTAIAALGLPGAGQQLGLATTPNSSRADYQIQYNNLLQQIDTLASDSSYNGANLLLGDNLNIQLNESGGSSIAIAGVTFDAAGLGLSSLSGTEFQSNTTIDGIIAGLDTALTALDAQSSKFGSSVAILQTRFDFTKSAVNILQSGADNLVLADTDQEGANLLALQTRQSLSITALSLTAQSDQGILKLFH